MTDRAARLRALTDEVVERDDVADAWTAKHFSDRLFVVEVSPDRELPDPVRERLHDHDLLEANEVYDVDAPDADYAGPLSNGRRYRFVDLPARGELQSYVVD